MPFKKSTLLTIGALVVFMFTYSDVFNNGAQPVGARTGAPSETTCGTSDCHNNTPNSGTGSVTITFSNPELKYIPGQTYDVTVKVSETSVNEFGFELTALDVANTFTPGTFLAEKFGVATSSPTSSSFPNRVYRAHKTSGSNSSWTFPWVAPSTNIGNITFYASGNAANGNNQKTGDHIYTTSLTISNDPTAIMAVSDNSSSFKIQSLIYNQIILSYNLEANTDLIIRMFDLNGRLLQTLWNGNTGGKGGQTNIFNLPADLEPGLYLINLLTPEFSDTRKIVIQK